MPTYLNGLILEHLEDIPDSQLSIEVAGYQMEIIEVSDNMIKQVRVLPNQLKKTG